MQLDLQSFVGACLESFNAHALELAIDGLNTFAIETKIIVVGPGVWLPVFLADGDQAHTIQGQPLFVLSRVVGFVCENAGILW